MSEISVYDNIDAFREKFDVNVKRPYEVIDKIKKLDDYLVLEFPNNIGISGMTFVKKGREKDYKCIYVNTNDRIGRRNFSFLHEMYHILYEKSKTSYSLNTSSDEIEKRAEIFASNILIPRAELLTELHKRGFKDDRSVISEDVICSLQCIFKVTFQAILYAIDNLNKYVEIKYPDKKEEFQKNIPKVKGYLKRYFKEAKWDEVDKLVLKKNSNNIYNTIKAEYIFPEDFKKNLLKNYSEERISYKEINILFEFFNEKFEEERK